MTDKVAILEAEIARLKLLLEQAQPVSYSVSVGRMIASNETTYHVVLTSSLRPSNASIFDGEGRITPFTSENYDHAVMEATEWAEFLNATSLNIIER